MTRILLAITLAFGVSTFSSTAMAADGSSGCGVGWYVTQKNSLVSSFIRSLTNATFLNSVSMTFGSSNCQKHDLVKNDKLQQHYAEANLDQLAVEMAVGDGEYLRGFAFVLGCSDAAYGDFSSLTQSKYAEIFGGEVDAAKLLERVKTEMKASPSVARGCAVTG